MNNVAGTYAVCIFIILIWSSQAHVNDKFVLVKCGYVHEDSSYDRQTGVGIIIGSYIPIIKGGNIVEYYSEEGESFYCPDIASLSSRKCL